MRIDRHLLYLVRPTLFLCVAMGLFFSGFSAPLYYDSALLKENEHIFSGQGLLGVINLFPQRPVTMASFYLNYVVGGLEPPYFRIANAAILALTACGVSLVIALLLESPALRGRGTPVERGVVAVSLGLVFLVHPVQTHVVLYIWQRMALLSSFFYIVALAVYLAARSDRVNHKAAAYVLCFFLFLMAVGSKETAITLPAALILFEAALFRPRSKELLQRAAACGLALVLAVAILSFLERAHGTETQHAGIVNALARYYAESGLTLTEVFVTQCRLLFKYVAVLVVPVPSNFLLVMPQVIYGSFLIPLSSLFAVATAMALPVLGLWLLRFRPLTGCGILLFMGNLVPEAFLVPQFLFFAYRAALPMLGLLLILADAVLAVLEGTRGKRWSTLLRAGTAATLVAIVTVMSWVTHARAELWSDPVGMWMEVVDALPRDGRKVERRGMVNALNNLGIAFQKAGMPGDALFYHGRAIEADPTDERSHVLLGKAYLRDGNSRDAEAAFRAALERVPDHAEALMGLGIVMMETDRLNEAVSWAEKAVALTPDNPRYRNDLGAMLLKRGDYPAAVSQLRRAVELSPGFVGARYQLSKALLATGHTDEAEEQLKKTVELSPDHVRALNDLAMILAGSGRVNEAQEHLRRILSLNPNDSVARKNLQNLLQQPGGTVPGR